MNTHVFGVFQLPEYYHYQLHHYYYYYHLRRRHQYHSVD